MSEKEISSKDSELEDIMNEIESLENDFPDEDANNELSKLIVEAEEEVSKAMQAESIDDVIEDTVAEAIDEIVVAEAIDEIIVAEPEMEAPVEEEPIMEETVAEEFVMETPVEEEPVADPILDSIEDIIDSEESSAKDSLAIHQDEVAKTKLQNAIDAEMDDILSEHAPEPVLDLENVVEMVAVQEEIVEAPVVPAMEPGEGAQTSMTFSMAGNAKINLNFEFNGQKVALHVDEKDGFVIEMNNGMKFSIPVEEKKAS